MNKISPMACIIEKVVAGSQSLSIRWVDGHTSIFHYLWLADNAPQSLNGRGQRLHDTTDLPLDIQPQSLYHSSDYGLEISWNQLPQPSHFSTVWLRMHCYTDQREIPQFSPWPGKGFSFKNFRPEACRPDLPPVHKIGCSTDDGDLFQAIRAVWREGIATVKEDAVEYGTMNRIKQWAKEAGLSKNFGYSCELESDGRRKTRSWSSQWWGVHTEHPDWKMVPALIWLPGLSSELPRWDLVMVDGFRIAEDLRVHHPAAFSLLSSIPVHFQGNMRQEGPAVSRSIIELDEEGAVSGMHFDQRLIAPFAISPSQMLAYYDAYQTLGRMLRDPMYQRRFRVLPEELFLIDNCRMLHGLAPATVDRHSMTEREHTGIDQPEPCLLEV